MNAQRKEFLTDILTMAIENGGTGWFYVKEYVWSDPLVEAYAVVVDAEEDDPQEHRIDHALIRHGINIIGAARDRAVEDGAMVLHNVMTGQRLYLSHDRRAAILKASRRNEAIDLDAIDALAIVECGLFGAVTYA